MSNPTSDSIRGEILAQLKRAKVQGRAHLEINAGELHRLLGGYPSKNHVMPIVCGVMNSIMKPHDKLIYQPYKKRGASLTIKYNLSN